MTVPLLMFRPKVVTPSLVKMFAPLRMSWDVALLWTSRVTFVPMTALTAVLPVPVPELVIIPAGLIVVPDSVMPLAIVLLLLRTRLPVPVTPPETVRRPMVPAPDTLLTSVVPPLFTARAPDIVRGANPEEFWVI